MSMQSTVLALRRFSTQHGSPKPRRTPALDWPTYLVVAAMAALSMVGYWSDKHFEDMSQGQEWSTDTGDAE